MEHDDERTELYGAAGVDDGPQIKDTDAGAAIQLWRAPNRIWPGFPTLIVVRAASRLRRGPGERPAPGQGGVVSVVLDNSKVGTIAPGQIKVYKVPPGDHSLSVRFLGGLRRSKKLQVPLAEGEKREFTCLLNRFGWPSIRLATPDDVATMEGPPSAPDDDAETA